MKLSLAAVCGRKIWHTRGKGGKAAIGWASCWAALLLASCDAPSGVLRGRDDVDDREVLDLTLDGAGTDSGAAPAWDGERTIRAELLPGLGNLVYTFNLLQSSADAAAVASYEWDFGDGRVRTGESVVYTFAAEGAHTVQVRGLDVDGQPVFQMLGAVQVMGGTTSTLSVNFTAETEAVDTDLAFTGTAFASGLQDGETITYSWRFADGTTQSGPSVEHLLTGASPYNVLLTGTTSLGRSAKRRRGFVLPIDPDVSPVADGGDPVVDEESDGGLGGGDSTEGSPAGIDLDNLPASTVVVSTAAEMADAAHLTHFQDLVILVQNDITLTDTTMLHNDTDPVVSLIGIGDHPELNLSMTFNGDWSRPDLYIRNGLHCKPRQVFIHNLALSGFNVSGSAIKGHHEELLDIDDCRFRAIGNVWYPPRVPDATNLEDMIFTQVVGAHGRENGHISVSNCRFEDGATNSHRWGHVLYMSARSTTVQDNAFLRCGDVFTLGGYVEDCVSSVFGNTVDEPSPSYWPDGTTSPPAMAVVRNYDYYAFIYNRVWGQFRTPWIGEFNPDRQLIHQNDYTELLYNDPWAADYSIGEMTLADWQNLPFDSPDADDLPASSMLVQSESELRSAARRSNFEPLNIVIKGAITVTDTIHFDGDTQMVRLLGWGSDARIIFDMDFNGDWDDSAAYARPGLQINCPKFIARNVAFSGYNLMGAALECNATELLDVSNCDFSNMGNTWYAPRIVEPQQAEDMIHSFCIQARNADAHVSLKNCAFNNSATNSRDFSYCLDISPQSASVTQNTFDGCGNTMYLGGAGRNAGITVRANRILRTAPAANADGSYTAPFLARLGQGDRVTFIDNSIEGDFSDAWLGSFNPTMQCVLLNDYSGMTYSGAWGRTQVTNTPIEWQTWQGFGFN